MFDLLNQAIMRVDTNVYSMLLAFIHINYYYLFIYLLTAARTVPVS